MLAHWGVLVLVLSLFLRGQGLDDDFLPPGAFRDDILFDLLWPGPSEVGSGPPGDPPMQYESQIDGEGVAAETPVDRMGTIGGSGEEEGVQEEAETERETSVGRAKPSNILYQEDSYKGHQYVDMRTGNHEQYRCVLPEISSWEEDRSKEEVEDEDMMPESLLKSLKGRCTKLVAGYWMYELCHWQHVRQYHEPMKVPKGKEDEYFLGTIGGDKASSDGAKTKISSSKTEDIPMWYFNGHEYPYYQVEMTGGTPCDLKGEEPRSVILRYICDMNAHVTGSFLHIEEVTTCKYEAVVATTNLCQNRKYRLKENPIHSVKCYSKDGSPRKPKSLLEHEVSMLGYLQGAKNQKSTTKTTVTTDFEGEEEEEGEREGRGERGSKNYPSDSRVNRQSVAQLDEGFIRSFLSGELCLRGGSGWWQHEVCYGKHVKQIHEESGKNPQELFLGYWIKEGHVRWFPNAGAKKQSDKHVTHLYINGDECDVTGVARQCKIKFRCVPSARASQISLFLEEPTTCNYVLTVEAAFLCPLLQHTDEYGLLGFSGGTGGGEKEVESGVKGNKEEEMELEYDDDGNVKSESLDPDMEQSKQNSEQSKKKRTVNQR